MSGTMVEPPPMTTSEPGGSLPPLEQRLPAEWQWSRRTAGIALLLAAVYLWFSVKPLWHTDVWGHLTYGRWLVTEGRLPATEPLLPLARGMPFVDTAWLAQVLGYLTYLGLGLAGVQGLSAMVIAATCGVVWWACWERTRHVGFAVLGLAVFLWQEWYTFAVVRPQLLGLLCFCVLWQRLTARRNTRLDDWLVPGLFVLWANLHGSFVLGLGLLAAYVAGRAFDVFRRTGNLRLWRRDWRLRRWVLWLELSSVAALLNPYGLRLYLEVWRFGGHPNLTALTEWQLLDVHAPHGQLFLAVALGLMVLYRFTPRRVTTAEVLLLAALGVASLGSARFLSWWGPVATVCLVTHLHASLRRWCPWRAEPLPSPRNGKWTVVTLGVLWIALAYSPLGMRLLHHKDPVLEKAVSDYTPLGAVNYLRNKPPSGLVFNVYEWGDYLLWAGPPGLQVFVNSHAHLIPREVWLHYLQVVEVASGWEEVLDRYGVTTVVVDPRHRSSLIRRLKDHSGWQVGYEDARSVVFVRRGT